MQTQNINQMVNFSSSYGELGLVPYKNFKLIKLFNNLHLIITVKNISY